MSEDRESGLAGDLFDRYLERAERLLENADRQSRDVRHWRAIAAMVSGVVSFLTVAIAVVLYRNEWQAGVVVLAGIAAVGVTRRLVNSRIIAPAEAIYQREEDAMIGLVTALRDAQPYLADEQGWDRIRRKQSLLRLQRFPLGGRPLT